MTQNTIEAGFCRDCLQIVKSSETRCLNCHSPRILRHAELWQLAIAHIDCDAFYAAVEKRDAPELRDKPVIIGGGKRGVVSTACYIARVNGVRSAMPMFQALKLCPDAVVIHPDMAKYSAVGRQIRDLMQQLTPLVEPISIDEAFLDLNGTARLTGQPPAVQLADLAQRIAHDIGISVSIGLSYNKFLAKIASDLNKPRGFSVLGKTEAVDFLKTKPVSFIWGVGAAMQSKLHRDGITKISQLQTMHRDDLMKRYGVMGQRMYYFSRGVDRRHVDSSSATKSISAETTFNNDTTDLAYLEDTLWKLAEKVSLRAKSKGFVGHTITIKLKTSSFKTRSRAVTLPDPTQLANRIFTAANPLLLKETDGTAFRLLGIGLSHLSQANQTDYNTSLDQSEQDREKAERAIDELRHKFGQQAVIKGRSLKGSRKV